MVFSMQIKLKDESLIPFVDSVFAKEGFSKEIKPEGELVYSVEDENGLGKIFGVFSPLDNELFIKKCYKWEMLKIDNNGSIYREDCLKELMEDNE